MSADAQSGSLSAEDRRVLRVLVADFEREWTEARIAEWMADLSPEDSLWRPAVTVLVRADLIQRWQRGMATPIDWYLRQWPELGAPAMVSPDLIFAEYEARRLAKKPHDVEELVRRFPAQANAVRRKVERLLLRTEAGNSGVKTNPAAHTPTAQVETATDDTGTRPTVDATPDLTGRFGRYDILRKLGAGGMGTVYLAVDSQLGRQVALKVPRFSSDDGPEVLERFFRESRAAALLRHPNICPLYDVGEVDGRHYLTMAYIEGRPLSHYVVFARKSQPLPEHHVAGVVRKIALAVTEAHRQGIVHRDLKPANIMVDRRREPIVMDFGLARQQASVNTQITRSGVILGTPAYMPPEQVLGDMTRIGPPCDLYALGIILYELLCGLLPFRGPVTVVLSKIVSTPPAPPSQYRPGLDPQLETICLRAIAKAIEDRYADVRQFAAELTGWMRQRSATAKETGHADENSLAAEDHDSLAAPAEEDEIASPRARWQAPWKLWPGFRNNDA